MYLQLIFMGKISPHLSEIEILVSVIIFKK